MSCGKKFLGSIERRFEMLGLTRWSPFEEVFNIQREVDRMFSQFWNDLPTRTAAGSPGSFQVNTTDDGWDLSIPLPGIDPRHVTLEAAGNTLSIRAEEPRDAKDKDARVMRYEQTFTIPQFLDLDKLTASHRHGMLTLRLPLKESVKPRRIEIESSSSDQKKLSAA
jgi:HSP20 family protein